MKTEAEIKAKIEEVKKDYPYEDHALMNGWIQALGWVLSNESQHVGMS